MTALAFTTGGCGYLDVDPELGLEDKEVFGTYSNFRSYFDLLYASGNGTNKENILYAFPMYSDFLQKIFILMV